MDMPVGNRSEIDRLTALVEDADPFDVPHVEVLPRQLEAINERFQDRVGKIKLLANRAEEGNVSEVREMKDIIPLLPGRYGGEGLVLQPGNRRPN